MQAGELLLPLLIATSLSSVFTPITIIIYKKLNWLDNPQTQKHPKHIHSQAIPRGG